MRHGVLGISISVAFLVVFGYGDLSLMGYGWGKKRARQRRGCAWLVDRLN